MFKARGTRAIFGFDTTTKRPDPEIEAAVVELERTGFGARPDPAPTPGYAEQVQAIDFDIALTMGMQPTLPPLPFDFAARVRAAYAGDMDAIKEMREIGDAIPDHMQVAFAEMVEALMDESVAA